MKNLFKTVLVVCVFVFSTTSTQAQQNSKSINVKQLEGVFRAAVYQDCSLNGKIDVNLRVKRYHHGSSILYFDATQNGRYIAHYKTLYKPGDKITPSDFIIKCRKR